MFTKAGDSETKEKLKAEEAKGEEKSEKGGRGDRVRVLAKVELSLPTTPLAASLWSKKLGKEKVWVCSQEGKCMVDSLS